MGFFFKRSEQLFAAASALPESNALALPQGILSDSSNNLAYVLFPDADWSAYPVTVGEAMAVPAVSKAIYLYSSISSRFGLNSSDNSTPWLSQGYGFTPASLRIAYTIQDLIFHNESLWQLERNENGEITVAMHVSRDRWSIATDGLKIDNKPFNPDNVIYFRGLLPGAGFLDNGRNSVRQYTSISRTVNARANNPAPITIVAETQDNSAVPEEVDAAMDALEAASQSGTRNAQIFQPYGIEFKAFGAPDNANEFMTSARNAVRLDLANFLNISASLLEGAADGTSDTYTNTLLVQNELLELSIKAFTEVIADRLSMDNVTAPGVKVSFDYSVFDTATTDNPTDKGTVPVPNEETE